MCKKVVVFDLDDTLYKEIDFLKPGCRKVAGLVEKQYGIKAETKETLSYLEDMDVAMCIITDGREITQKQKIEALGLAEWISMDNVMINEEKAHAKPNHWSYDRIMLKCYKQFPDMNLSFCYVGDNPDKDFIAPNQIGWDTVCLLDDGRNIHNQKFDLPKDFLPKHKIINIKELQYGLG